MQNKEEQEGRSLLKWESKERPCRVNLSVIADRDYISAAGYQHEKLIVSNGGSSFRVGLIRLGELCRPVDAYKRCLWNRELPNK